FRPVLFSNRRYATHQMNLRVYPEPRRVPHPFCAFCRKGGLFRSTAGCPTRRFCAWVLGFSFLGISVAQSLLTVFLGLSFLALSSRPERPELLFRAVFWRVGPRSGGIVATSLVHEISSFRTESAK